MIFLDISGWFGAMEILEKVYWFITIPFSLIFLILLVLTFFGGDMDDVDGDPDAAVDADDGIGFQFITLKNLVAFFTLAGWSGLACIQGEMSTTMSILISIICGLAMMFIMAGLYYFISKMSASGTLNVKNAMNKTGEVYLTIPPKRNGFGKVQVKVQGALRELDAMTDEDEEIKTGSLIDVIEVKDNNILIVKRSS